jgi:regulator of protease activity HflC (stomatin/prohibitin superfamily)
MPEYRYDWKGEKWEKVKASKWPIMVIAFLIVLAVFIAFTASMVVMINAGEVAVITDPLTNTLSPPRKGPAYILKMPWQGVIRDFHTIDYVSMTAEKGADYPPITVLTRDGVTVSVEVTFTYEVEPDKFDVLAKNYPRVDYEEARLVPLMMQVVRDVISQYSTDDCVTKRSEIARSIEYRFREVVSVDSTLTAIKLHDVNLRGVTLPSTIAQAIERKIAAYQEMLAAQYQREREITLANATAMKQIIQATAEAETYRIKVSALSSILRELVNATGDSELARLYMMMEYLTRLQNATLIISPASPVPTIPIVK